MKISDGGVERGARAICLQQGDDPNAAIGAQPIPPREGEATSPATVIHRQWQRYMPAARAAIEAYLACQQERAREEAAAIQAILDNPPPPTEKAKEAVRRYREMFPPDLSGSSAYRKGEEDMRERAAKECEEMKDEPDDFQWNCALGFAAEAIRSLPVTGEK